MTTLIVIFVTCLITLVIPSSVSQRQLPPGNIIIAYVDNCDNSGHDALGKYTHYFNYVLIVLLL
jgi:hypothetical protein